MIPLGLYCHIVSFFLLGRGGEGGGGVDLGFFHEEGGGE